MSSRNDGDLIYSNRSIGGEGMIEKAIIRLMREFHKSADLFHSEHGYHARFIHFLYEVAPGLTTVTWRGKSLAKIQSEFPTPNSLGRSVSQNWDVAVLGEGSRVEAVIEFGVNAQVEDVCLYRTKKKRGEAADLKWKTPHMLDDADRLFRARTGHAPENAPYKSTDFYLVELFRTNGDAYRKENTWRKLCRSGAVTREEWVTSLATEQEVLCGRWTRSRAKGMENLQPYFMSRDEIAERMALMNVFVGFVGGTSRHLFRLAPSDDAFVRIKPDAAKD
jgi:hypothetical protein